MNGDGASGPAGSGRFGRWSAGGPAADVAPEAQPAAVAGGPAPPAPAPAPAPGSWPNDLLLLERADATLSAVELALRRFDDGSYGKCEVCGVALSDDELEAAPALARCPQHAGSTPAEAG
jgi:hypothetical protein